LVLKEAISLAAEIGAGAPNWPAGGGLVVAVNVSGVQLEHFPIDCIKIDRRFVAGMTETTEDFAIVDAVIALGRTMGHAVVAEGVESQEQADALLKMGCTVAQGYLYAKPMCRDDAIAFLARSQNPSVPLIGAQRVAPELPDAARTP